MKKKIAIIIERANIVLGGAERSVFEVSMALSSLGHEVDILAAKGQTKAKHIHILCEDVGGKRVNHATFGRYLKQYLSEHKYDIVHSVLPYDFADVYQPRGGSYAESIIRNAASYENKYLNVYKKVTSFLNIRRAMLYSAERKLCRGEDGPVVAALSNYVGDQFRRHYGLDEKRLVVIPNGVKVQKEIDKAATDKLRSQILSKLELTESSDPLFFLFVANNFRLKGLRPLIEAMGIACRKRTERPIFLAVAGRGKSQKYRLLARKEKVHKRIIFLGPIRHIQNALSITDVAVLPTFYDPASRFIIEALSDGMPVITTRFNGASDLFADGRHGIVIEKPENVESLAKAMCYFADSKNIEQASAKIQKDGLEERISIMRVARDLNGLYNNILKGRGK